MKKVLSIIAGILMVIFIVGVLMICILTPEKTDDGEYTDVIKYWTDIEYGCRYFKCDK